MRHSQATVDGAIDVLDGVIKIAEYEMLVQGMYVSDEISNPALSNSVCGGRQACLIGSLWLSGGIVQDPALAPGWLPMIKEDERHLAFVGRPHLKLAYEALNEVAAGYAERHDIELVDERAASDYDSDAEQLFEHGLSDGMYDHTLIRDHVIALCNEAKRAIKTAHAEHLDLADNKEYANA